MFADLYVKEYIRDKKTWRKAAQQAEESKTQYLESTFCQCYRKPWRFSTTVDKQKDVLLVALQRHLEHNGYPSGDPLTNVPHPSPRSATASRTLLTDFCHYETRCRISISKEQAIAFAKLKQFMSHSLWLTLESMEFHCRKEILHEYVSSTMRLYNEHKASVEKLEGYSYDFVIRRNNLFGLERVQRLHLISCEGKMREHIERKLYLNWYKNIEREIELCKEREVQLRKHTKGKLC